MTVPLAAIHVQAITEAATCLTDGRGVLWVTGCSSFLRYFPLSIILMEVDFCCSPVNFVPQFSLPPFLLLCFCELQPGLCVSEADRGWRLLVKSCIAGWHVPTCCAVTKGFSRLFQDHIFIPIENTRPLPAKHSVRIYFCKFIKAKKTIKQSNKPVYIAKLW